MYDAIGEQRNRAASTIFCGIAQSPEWNLLLEVFRYFVGHTLAHADIDEAWRDRVHGNVLPRKLTGGDLGERDDRSLARRVISLAEKAHLPANR